MAGSAPDRIFANTRFLRLWTAQSASLVGDAVSMIALVVLMAQLTGGALAVGTILLVRLAPALASPLIGVLADRLDRRTVLVAGALTQALLMLLVAFVRDLVLLHALAFLLGAARAFYDPTLRASVPSVVGRENLVRANSLLSGTFSASIMLGPVIGGVLVGTLGVGGAFLFDAATFLVSAALLAQVPLPRSREDADRTQDEGNLWRNLKIGFGFLSGALVPLAVLIGAVLNNFAVTATAPADVFLARDVFGAGDAGYGLLVSVFGTGMLGGATLTGLLGNRVNLFLLYFGSLFAFALALAALGLAPAFLVALLLVGVAGLTGGVDDVASETILQQRVPDNFLGYVFSLRYMGFSAAESLAYPVGGLLVDTLDTRQTYIVLGCVSASTALLVLTMVLIGEGRKNK